MDKYCKHCNCNHELTKEHWYFNKSGSATCKVKHNERAMSRYQADRDHKMDQHKAWYERNKQKESIRNKKRYADKKDILLSQHKEWRKNNRSKLREQEYTRYHSDPQFKLIQILRKRMYHAINKNQKVGSAVRDLGCSIPNFKSYLESQFRDGMTWENWGSVWELDHIIPCASFNLTDRTQFLKCAHYSNLQPLLVHENRTKSDKIELAPCEGDFTSKASKNGEPCDGNTVLSQLDNTTDQCNAYQMILAKQDYNSGTSVRNLFKVMIYAELHAKSRKMQN